MEKVKEKVVQVNKVRGREKTMQINDEYMILRLKMKTLAKGRNQTTVRVWERKGRNRGLVCFLRFLYVANIATILTRPSTSRRRILQQKTFVSA
jgi:hypothetical protein